MTRPLEFSGRLYRPSCQCEIGRGPILTARERRSACGNTVSIYTNSGSVVILAGAGKTVANRVGPKGQVVIDRSIRDRLGVEPGMLAIQRLVDDHVEIRFVHGPHHRSLAGAARPFIRRRPAAGERDATELAWDAEVRRHLPDAQA